MNKLFASLKIRSVQEDERVVEGIASTGRRDRMADEVVPRGVVYALPIPFLLDHDHKQAVGEVESLEVTDTEIRFRARLPKIAEEGAAKELVDRAWSYLKHGLRKNVSIGFRALGQERIDGGGLRFTSWELLELSAVSVPANADARVTTTRAAHHTAKLTPVRGHVAKLGVPAATVKLRRGEYDAHVHWIARHNVGQPADRKLSEPTYTQWLMVEQMLDSKVPGRKAKREARLRAAR